MSLDHTDKAKAVRPGEDLSTANLMEWLRGQDIGLFGVPKVTQYSGGASNWTYCLEFENTSLILRRAPAGTKAKGAHDMGREFKLQQALKPVYDYVPKVLAYCDDVNVLGSEFYLMEKLTGIIPRKNMPQGLTLSPNECNSLCKHMLDSLIDLHSLDYRAAKLEHLGKGKGYASRQIQGWDQRYLKAKTWNVPGAARVRAWLNDNIPTQEHICVTHNDFRLDNLVLCPQTPTRIIGVLDWELATLGDPLMDLGNSLAYWVEEQDDFMAKVIRRQPTHLPGMFTRKQVVEYYLNRTGMRCDDFSFYEVYGLFRLAAIVQQIYYRYHHKQTRNPNFRFFWVFVHYLIWRCEKVIKAGGTQCP